MEEEAGGRGPETRRNGGPGGVGVVLGSEREGWIKTGTRSFQASRVQPRSLVLASGGAREPGIYFFLFSHLYRDTL